jgi:hypothetical protein
MSLGQDNIKDTALERCWIQGKMFNFGELYVR